MAKKQSEPSFEESTGATMASTDFLNIPIAPQLKFRVVAPQDEDWIDFSPAKRKRGREEKWEDEARDAVRAAKRKYPKKRDREKKLGKYILHLENVLRILSNRSQGLFY